MRLRCALAAAMLLAGCGRHAHAAPSATPSAALPSATPAVTSATTRPSGSADRLGYVRMSTLVHEHPLGGRLDILDRQIAELRAELADPAAAHDGAGIVREQQALNAQLSQAARDASELVRKRGRELENEEHAAVAQLLVRSGYDAATAARIEHDLAAPAPAPLDAKARAQADSFRKALETQQNATLRDFENGLTTHDERIYRERVDALSAQENESAVAIAQDDAAERAALTAKANDLTLKPDQHRAVVARLADLDAKEKSAHDAEVAADTRELNALQRSLHAASQRAVDREIATLRTRGEAQLRERDRIASVQAGASPGAVAPPRPVALDAKLRDRIRTIHDSFQARFDRETKQSVAEFGRKRALLQTKFDALSHAQGVSQDALAKQLSKLEAERAELARRVSRQISSDAASAAREAGVKIVFSDVLAAPGSVDLTDAVGQRMTNGGR